MSGTTGASAHYPVAMGQEIDGDNVLESAVTESPMRLKTVKSWIVEVKL